MRATRGIQCTIILHKYAFFCLSEKWKEIWQWKPEIWETYDTEIIDGHLLHTQGFNSLPRTYLMTVLSSEMAMISPESELQLYTDPIGDY